MPVLGVLPPPPPLCSISSSPLAKSPHISPIPNESIFGGPGGALWDDLDGNVGPFGCNLRIII